MKRGYTFVELIIVVAILGILVLVAGPIYNNLQSSTILSQVKSELTLTLREARENSIARLDNASYGVYFDVNLSGIDSYVLYTGDSYATRNSSNDIIKILPNITNLTTSLVGNEVHFSKGKGLPDNTGSISLSHPTLGGAIISINSLGVIDEN